MVTVTVLTCLYLARRFTLNSSVVGVLRVGAPTAPEVILRLDLTVKASSCVEPGSSFSDPQCSGKGKCITQPSEVRNNGYKIIESQFLLFKTTFELWCE